MLEAGMLKRWRLAPPPEADVVDALVRSQGVPPLVATLLSQRGQADRDVAGSFLRPKLTDLHDPRLVPGLADAAERIARAVRERQPIVVYGDYDVDGVTAGAILWHMLGALGGRVTTYVPHRIEEGYGLNPQAIEQIIVESRQAAAGGDSDGTVSGGTPLIISVDCGITAVEPAKVARRLGADLIITDHHEFDPANLPDACALVHPRLERGGVPAYPFDGLCGAGVAFKLAWHVARVVNGSERLPEKLKTLLLDLMAFAALGTVADVVPLVGENRVLTTYGLGRIKQTTFAGLNALIDASRLRDEKIDSYHVGFVLGPRLNAAGRMGHARTALRLLTDAPPAEAAEIASFLTGENESRRATEREIFEEAKAMVKAGGYDGRDSRAIVLGKAGWHPGVVGIVASRLVEAFARPVVMLSLDPESGEAHGSARSVDGVSIHEAIGSCAGLLSSFGGHAMAAGLRFPSDRLDAFRDQLVTFVNQRLGADDLVAILPIDAECSLAEIDLEIGNQLQRLAPFGRGNPSPVLCVRGAVVERSAQRMGGEGKHLSVMLRQGQRLVRAVGWSMGDFAPKLPAGSRIDAAVEIHCSEWQGVRRAEAHLKDIKIL
ncbi:MAG: single-stranded-DNA-specific exonuclease RecJ [Planctomycetota bacterium]|nr:single-stranded-DNA-specific exonuclease RecJ [Planctomycetota bacterium]